MSVQPFNGPASQRRCALYCALLLLAGVSAPAAAWFTPRGSNEVAPIYKANRVPELNIAAYEEELIDCSALAGIHTWIGDNLTDSGAEVRKKINQDYWINVSKAYLNLAEQAAGKRNLNKEMGARMRLLATEFRELTEAPVESANWGSWYDLVERCDSWRSDRPSQAFYSNGRKPSTRASKGKDLAKAPF